MQSRRRKNLNVLVPCFITLAIMCGLVAYSPELYRAFCGATGYGGTTQRAYGDPASTSQKTVTVAFDSNVSPGLPWRFEPEQRSVTVHLGEQKLVFFSAENLSDQATVGHATFNVTPPTSGIYFNKIQCFCFNEERLDPHQRVDMPVVFYVDPAFSKDSDMDHVDTITLSYTFGRSASPSQAKDLARFLADAAPDAIHGRELFTQRCTACHALDRNKIGPMLGGVVGRTAGSVARYNYSAALRNAGLVWSVDKLDQWLADPKKAVPGARMPVRVLDAPSRHDIIAYLQKVGVSGQANGKTRTSEPEY
ncbi:cytochrome c oxidase assembly protein [Bradyrhizobium arachidis]|uniref:cytochrome c oxidase assembly protein n=1 Tax=Bradyrhizobium TaxID=374 RepID=UPI00188B9A35|nr:MULTISPECIES: cytochrome c oxidase assembly protein [Bradyrhizobium]QOZ51754.1 cytochrome c oxidase assembly protein [Bradyrhizobium sp. CCBAU 53338]UVO38926.1 cytochrome c oxidase assembly protein [Bradyrhizobium arachidis]